MSLAPAGSRARTQESLVPASLAPAGGTSRARHMNSRARHISSRARHTTSRARNPESFARRTVAHLPTSHRPRAGGRRGDTAASTSPRPAPLRRAEGRVGRPESALRLPPSHMEVLRPARVPRIMRAGSVLRHPPPRRRRAGGAQARAEGCRGSQRERRRPNPGPAAAGPRARENRAPGGSGGPSRAVRHTSCGPRGRPVVRGPRRPRPQPARARFGACRPVRCG